jgi:hypothetical protein
VLGAALIAFASLLPLPAQPVDLLARYPTTLTASDANPDHARAWNITEADVFRVSSFHFAVGPNFRVEVGTGDLGIGHCPDGAVWAVLIPREHGKLISSVTTNEETVGHVWLRFHPCEITRLFPPQTVSADGAGQLVHQMRVIANAKMICSWQAGGRAMIPGTNEMTVDVDTKAGPRRFFVVDTRAETARYVAAFARRAVKPPPALTPALAAEAFDRLWQAFDRDYAMFVLRPEVDWARLRDQYRPKALAAKSSYEFAAICAEMLKPLRDLHIWLKVAGSDVPVFNRPRSSNANPAARRALLGSLEGDGNLQWATTADQLGYISISAWNGEGIADQFDEVLEDMKDTRGLIIDVRLNGGGDEPTAGKVAGRFLDRDFVYAYSQFRNGPRHTDLTEKIERTLSPRGPWRYHRPVILLIGQKCMSSNESFIAMMSGDPDVIIIGDHTCGSSGNPEMVNLPMSITVSVPRWIDYLPDGTTLDERGFQPQVQSQPTAGAFEGTRDDLLSAALERLRQAPLPAGTAAVKATNNIRRTATVQATNAVPQLRVSVDPRVELLSLIFRLAGNHEYNQARVPSYAQEAENQFGGFREHHVVQLARELQETRGVSYDACMGMAVHLTDALDPKLRIPLKPWPESLDQRWTASGAEQFLAAAREFIKDTDFQKFIKGHQSLYETTETRLKTMIERQGHLEWFGAFFGERPRAAFTVIPGLLNGGCCYGPHFRDPKGNEELYCVLGVWQTDAAGLPEFSGAVFDTVVHEFTHSYANQIIDRHLDELRPAGDKLFPAVSQRMEAQAYGEASTMLRESLVRACGVRYVRDYRGAAAARRVIEKEKQAGFLWMQELPDLLGEYEAHRDKYPTLETFAPRLVSFFNDYAATFIQRQSDLAAKQPKVVSMSPANGAASVAPGLTEIRVTFDRPMKGGSWSMCGDGPNFPELVGKPHYDAERTTWTVPAKLKPNWEYEFWLNSPSYTSFRSEEDVPLESVAVTFKTGDEPKP